MKRIRKVLPDLIILAGFVVIGIGLAQWSKPAALIYAGLVLLGVGYIAVSITRKEKTR